MIVHSGLQESPPACADDSDARPSSTALTRAVWQDSLFADATRSRLLGLAPGWARQRVAVRVHRNHGFEAVASVVPPWAAWNLLDFDFTLGSYDDSLSWTTPGNGAAVDLVWLDLDRITTLRAEERGAWLCERIAALRKQTANPILVAAWPLGDIRAVLERAAIPGVHLADLDAVAASMGNRFVDARLVALSGTRLSDRACVALARELACRWLPACALPPRKAIVVDLDETLYRGVLGEDGASGVELTDGHRSLQQYLKDCAASGIFLALVSRNELADVQQLFLQRSDFPLRLTDFTTMSVAWSDKGEAMKRIASDLRIATDSMAFVDDNPGELAAMAMSCSALTVHAKPDASRTLDALAHVAGLFRFTHSTEDGLRSADLTANRERDALLEQAGSAEDYLRSLGVRLSYAVSAADDLPRAHELVRKTNQFNLSLRRLSEAELAERTAAADAGVVTIRLSDRLSDSGLVGVVSGKVEGADLQVDVVAVSCRALGRRLEDTMITQALRLLVAERPVARVVFAVEDGPRNQPAREWLATYLADCGETADERAFAMTAAALRAKTLSDAVTMEVR